MNALDPTDPVPVVAQCHDWSSDVWAAVLRSLRRVVPYIDVEDLDRTVAIRDEADLDSLDFVRLITAVAEETGVLVPERDYSLVSTLADLAAYVDARVAAT